MTVASVLILATLVFDGCATGTPESTSDGIFTETVRTGMGGEVYPQSEGYATAPTTCVRHWYSRTGSPDSSPVILINGSDFPANVWHPGFIEGLLSNGFQVVSYDPRDCGRSERLPWPKGFKAGGPPTCFHRIHLPRFWTIL